MVLKELPVHAAATAVSRGVVGAPAGSYGGDDAGDNGAEKMRDHGSLPDKSVRAGFRKLYSKFALCEMT